MAHKAREFAAHLRMARYAWTQGRVTTTAVRQGVAVLEGGYSDDDKRALSLAGFRVCSLGTLAETLALMGLVEHATD